MATNSPSEPPVSKPLGSQLGFNHEDLQALVNRSTELVNNQETPRENRNELLDSIKKELQTSYGFLSPNLSTCLEQLENSISDQSAFSSALDSLLKAIGSANDIRITSLIDRYKIQQRDFDFIKIQHDLLLYFENISDNASEYVTKVTSMEGNLEKNTETLEQLSQTVGRFSVSIAELNSSVASFHNQLTNAEDHIIERVKGDLVTKTEFNNLIQGSDGQGGFRGELIRLIQGTDGQGGLQGKIDFIKDGLGDVSTGNLSSQIKKLDERSQGLNFWMRVLAPALINACILLAALMGGYASLTSYISSEIKDKTGTALQAELDKKGGIKSQITSLNTAQKKNDELLTKISDKLGVKR
jgi:chromosome segregation ATPase